jgi:hypothetical protein
MLGEHVQLAPRHERVWEWFAALTPGIAPRPLVECWGRGGGKSTTIEGGVAWLGSEPEPRRHFVLYVSRTQAQANAHVQAIGTELERASVQRDVNRYNQSKGWTQSLLRAAHGFNVLAFGLDAAMRGIKIDLFRPDLIVLDDIDDKDDSLEQTQKKIETLTETVLPAGSLEDAAIVFVQNMIHPDSIMAQLADGRADFLHDRLPVVVEPAVRGLTYERRTQPDGTARYVVTGGEPTWTAQSLYVVESQINKWGLTAFLREAQHEVADDPSGIFGSITFQHIAWSAIPMLEEVVVWCDPAVTNTDASDSHAIQADARGVDGKIYRLWSWEHRASPLETLCRALLKAVELKASRVGVETDQGGDTWRSVYDQAWDALVTGFANISGEAFSDLRHDQQMIMDLRAQAALLGMNAQTRKPKFASAKAGAGHGPKAERGERMKLGYERGQIVHVIGTHETLERALRRYLKRKPFDLGDAAYWSWWDVSQRSANGWTADDLSKLTTT